MTLQPHSTVPNAWTATSPFDFIGWNVEPTGLLIGHGKGIVTLWRFDPILFGMDGQFTSLTVECPVVIVPVLKVQFIPMGKSHRYSMHVHRRIEWMEIKDGRK